jgi:hypothetical protein
MARDSNITLLQNYMNSMCDALKIDCVCADTREFVELSDMTEKLTYIVESGFLPLFTKDDTTSQYSIRQNISKRDWYTALSYYNFAFTAPNRKRKRDAFLFNNLQCILKKILDKIGETARSSA